MVRNLSWSTYALFAPRYRFFSQAIYGSMTIIYSNSVTICFSFLTYLMMFMFLMSVFLFTFLTYVQQRRLAACSRTIKVGFTWFYADIGTFVGLIWALSVNQIYEIFTVKATVKTPTNSGKHLYHGIPLSEWAFDKGQMMNCEWAKLVATELLIVIRAYVWESIASTAENVLCQPYPLKVHPQTQKQCSCLRMRILNSCDAPTHTYKIRMQKCKAVAASLPRLYFCFFYLRMLFLLY